MPSASNRRSYQNNQRNCARRSIARSREPRSELLNSLDATDDGILSAMKEVPFTQFRRNASIMLERVRRTRKPILVTHSGEPLAVVVPVGTSKKKSRPSVSARE